MLVMAVGEPCSADAALSWLRRQQDAAPPAPPSNASAAPAPEAVSAADPDRLRRADTPRAA